MAAMINEIPEEFRCSTCVYGGRPDGDGLVECRRYPPEVFVLADGTVMQLRPRLGPDDGCGEKGYYCPNEDGG